MSNKKIAKGCPHFECIRCGSVCCEAGAKIGNGRDLGRDYAKKFCLHESGYKACAVYVTAKEAEKGKK